jgi:penicillin amidase
MNETVTNIRTHWVVLLSLALSLGLAGAGCGDDDPEETNNGTVTDAGDTSDAGDTADTADAALPEGFYIEGLSAPVKVQFDSSGVLHVDCQTNNDCYAAQGYFHADDRFFEMDLIRRQIRGELSQVIGSLGLDSDKQFRHLMTTSDGTPLEEAYIAQVSDETMAMLEAYAKGVNAWIHDMRTERNGATLTKEYDFPLVATDTIRDWEPEDTIALYLMLAYQLGETATDDLFRGEMAAELDPAVAADIFSVKPGLESNIMQASGVDPSTMLRTDLGAGGKLDPEIMRAAKERLHPALDAMRQARKRFTDNPSLVMGPKTGEDGSNNWALGPDRTANGKTLLADDPHLSLNSPAIWYFVELDSKTNGQGDLHVAGASVPAVPGIVVGHNDQVAWGVTTARLDLADAYIEELTDDGTAVMFDGQEVPLVQKEFTFKTSGGGTRTETFEWVPHHGPLISKDVENNRGVSMRWTLQEGGNDIDFLQGLQVATNVEEAMDAMGPVRSINQNWVFADRAGTIAWYPKGAIPNRPFATGEDAMPNWLPLPGDGTAEWDGYLADEDSPKMVDPAEGFIATANNDFDGSYTDGDSSNDGHSPWQSPPAYGHRHKRIVDMIEEGGNDHSVETMNEIQADTYVLHGELLVPHILQIANDNSEALSADAQAVVDALTAWQYTCPTGLDGSDPVEAGKASDALEASESIGCSAFHVILPYLTAAIFADEIGDAYETLANWSSLQAALIYVFDSPENLNNGDAYFDDVSTDASAETKDDIVLAVLETTAEKLASDKLFGSSTPDDWRWGRIHTVSFVSLFSAAGVDLFDVGPFANDGGFFTVDVANPTGRAGDFEDTFNHPNGPSLRLVMEASDTGIDAWFQLPGGQDHHEDSQFYGSLIDEWLNNTPTELLYDRDAVDADAVETIEVNPVP